MSSDGPHASQHSEHKKRIQFKVAHFECRSSLLTSHWNGTAGLVFNVFAAAFALMTMGTLIRDTVMSQNPVQHFWLILWNFEQFPQTMFVWLLMLLSTIVFAYGGLFYWSGQPSKSVTLKSEWPFLVAYIGYMSALFFYPLRFLFTAKLNCACSFIITCENTRLAMKCHSFVRENIHRCVQNKVALSARGVSEEPRRPDYPTLKQFLYFLFAPTFIYRDEYPKATKRDWKLVGQWFAHCLGSIYVVNLLFINFIKPQFERIDYANIGVGELLYLIFPSIIPGAGCLLMLFYGLLHSWQNMFAEAMEFGDRQFYLVCFFLFGNGLQNWWNSRNMAEYYRNWNLVVHEWLYAYVYRDISVATGSRIGQKIGQTLVFFLSAAFHEYWFGVSLRLFYPIMFNLYFVCGGIFFCISRLITSPQMWNVMMWFNLLIGTGMFVSCYATEWYARQQCSQYFTNPILDVFVPRLWTCSL